MFPDVQPTSELACSQAEALEIFDALIDKMNPLLREAVLRRTARRASLPTVWETEAGDSLGNQNAACGKQRSPRLRGHQATQVDHVSISPCFIRAGIRASRPTIRGANPLMVPESRAIGS